VELGKWLQDIGAETLAFPVLYLRRTSFLRPPERTEPLGLLLSSARQDGHLGSQLPPQLPFGGFRPESYDVYFVCHCSRVLACHLLIPARSDSFLRTHRGSSTRVRIAHRESKELTACRSLSLSLASSAFETDLQVTQYPVFRATRECAGPRKVVDYVTSRENATPRNTKRINRALPGSKSKLRRMPIYGTCR